MLQSALEEVDLRGAGERMGMGMGMNMGQRIQRPSIFNMCHVLPASPRGWHPAGPRFWSQQTLRERAYWLPMGLRHASGTPWNIRYRRPSQKGKREFCG